MLKKWMLLLTVMGIAAAQDIDLGAWAGGGGIAASGPISGAGSLGVEACVFCNGRLALFSEYTHWFATSGTQGYNASDVVSRADLAGAGMRIQGLGRIRPFFDLGLVGGWDAHVAAGSGGALGGGVIGGGVRIPLRAGPTAGPSLRAISTFNRGNEPALGGERLDRCRLLMGITGRVKSPTAVSALTLGIRSRWT